MSSVLDEPDSGAVRLHLQAILKSPQFVRSRRLKRFLEYIVERKLSGRVDEIQEYTLALEVFDRPESFDPRSESIVRVEARRLRDRLSEYYAGDGRTASVRVVLPERGYIPSFEQHRVRTEWPSRAGFVAVTAVLLAAAAYGLSLFATRPPPSPHEPTPEAREAFEMGMAAWQRWTGESARSAVAYFQDAVTRDPEYARAYAWLSTAYRQQAIMGDITFAEIADASSASARAAIAIAPEQADGHLALAVHLTFEPDWAAAEAEFRRALELAPDDADIHHALGIVLLATAPARLGEAEAELRQAVSLQPGALGHRVVLGKILYFQERFSEARTELEEALAIDAHYPDGMRNLASVLVQLGESPAAIELLREAQRLAPLAWGDGLLGHALAVSGDAAGARAILTNLESGYGAGPVGALAVATVHVGLDDPVVACEWLGRAWDLREIRSRYIAVDPIYAPLRHQACFTGLLEEMRLDDVVARKR